MPAFALPSSFRDYPVFMVGIKGTGMTALAEYLLSLGARLSGSDTHERFYTDSILRELGISFSESFSPGNIPEDTRLVVYSAAYDPSVHVELVAAAERGIPCITYPEALGAVSALADSSGISGVHGKTTTTALAGTLAKALGLPVSVIVGSAVSNFGGRSTLVLGSRFLIAETCEYRRHFLSFHPKRIVVTSIEPDHLDYFAGYADILDAFVSYGLRLPRDGELIYCADDSGAREASSAVRDRRPDVRLTPYGETASGRFAVRDIRSGSGRSFFRLEGFSGEFSVRIPGKHTILNAAAACALSVSLLESMKGTCGDAEVETIRKSLLEFSGSKRRSEIIGEARGVLFMDDYAHHPTAIRTTLAGLKEFYPDRRIVADFMSHTYSRTKALFEDFASSFSSADEVILHKIYPSARETGDWGISGRDLAERASRHHARVRYFEEVADAREWCADNLRPGDLFVTLGAGNNFELSWYLYERMKKEGDVP